MKTAAAGGAAETAAIVRLASTEADAADGSAADAVARARAFAEPLLAGRELDSGEDTLAHADGVAAVLRGIGGAPSLCAAAYLVYAGDHLQRPEDVVRKAFGDSAAGLVALTRKLMQIQRTTRAAQHGADHAEQTERVRKMLLAFSRDLRVVLLRLASRLQTLRWHAANKHAPCPMAIALESQQVFAPLASRLGIWQIKWELEDLAFRFLDPVEYQRIARLVDETRAAREASVGAARAELAALLDRAGLRADVHGRPKHLYSIYRKMRGKGLDFARIFDTRALRVVVDDVPTCYAVLARVHETWTPVDGEFDDYVARPKANGYQSLHTVVRDAAGRTLEVQIRTREMHAHAEHGVAAHWMYKEGGARGTAQRLDAGDRIAEARKAVLRELLAWERDHAAHDATPGTTAFDDRVYVFTPQAAVVELPAGGTPVDFAYSLHSDVGHRCRGAKVDGAIVPLNTPLRSGQTVEIVTAKDGGPSLDWLNPELGYLAGGRARAKVRAWFNARAQRDTIARGRELVERLLQREGRTAVERDALALDLGLRDADALYEVVGKDELSLRTIENLLRPAAAPADDAVALHRARSDGTARGGVLVVGLDTLLTSLAKCCRPVPPDAITGYVTRGRGVAVHRRDCPNLRQMTQRAPERVIDVAWGAAVGDRAPVYPLDIVVDADERHALLRDLSEVFVKQQMNVVAVQTHAGAARAASSLHFTVETRDVARLPRVLAELARVDGVHRARRR